ncbi:hypothetical protein A3H03_00215 [Candidatus Kuenenbacteria bacterium RIFCSPLOWO2_12_FULL_42_13]|uniref:Uncharacterized protein n=4 Tax=Candidatus Kueneniibacteriota TaxID=1752740 RepID=A0A0G1BZ50_9BACT|nr:MAG: hypothetical protein UV02_C0008G0003 [Candidatus Kuenenbacteria bacterium GW2011_GWA2_42_15]OGG90433.1 MAG: hypothetical protein A3H55_03095 [Candidatus Kuenenbacteria bacterium RIFCSPLOWO2_02_FULL_42_16]OGG91401.1 MAG: hypothetical protein A3H03_00215 [Candidatus Kuenenbacteria bacterium RIFCSPLOWO2_12_FULL_42_13]OGH00593.1 MAG: hypothetical protein A3E04_02795 [Candidatus Kuenenbacteria bacterium RIFCSPHIGHO2_12_FULL_42_14]
MDNYNLILWSGRIAAIFLALNFLTCFAMPWSKTKCLWKGELPGPDKCDSQGFKPIAYAHRLFVWLTITFTVLHIVLAIAD